jgi:hypothetical protein
MRGDGAGSVARWASLPVDERGPGRAAAAAAARPRELRGRSSQPNAWWRANRPMQAGELLTFSDPLADLTVRYAASRVGYVEQSNNC